MADLTVPRGGALLETITIYDATGAVFPLAGSTVWFTVKELDDMSADDAAAPVKLSWVSGGASSGITVTTPSTGVIVVKITGAQSAALLPDRTYRWDVKVKDTNSDPWYPVKGLLHVDPVATGRVTTP